MTQPTCLKKSVPAAVLLGLLLVPLPAGAGQLALTGTRFSGSRFPAGRLVSPEGFGLPRAERVRPVQAFEIPMESGRILEQPSLETGLPAAGIEFVEEPGLVREDARTPSLETSLEQTLGEISETTRGALDEGAKAVSEVRDRIDGGLSDAGNFEAGAGLHRVLTGERWAGAPVAGFSPSVNAAPVSINRMSSPRRVTEADVKAQVAEFQGFFERFRTEFSRIVVGQEEMRDSMLIGLIADGHVLIEGPPGAAKSVGAETIATMGKLPYQKLPMTPDLQPGDITGTEIMEPGTKKLKFREGPVFTSILVADELNRAMPRTQAALLQAMQEKKVSSGRNTRPLPEVFMVLATMNPYEHEGTYPLPEAQLDRFMMKIHVPHSDEVARIVQLSALAAQVELDGGLFDQATVLRMRETSRNVKVDKEILLYIQRLIRATRPHREESPDWWKEKIRGEGVSARGGQALARAAQVQAMMEGRHYVTPADVQVVANRILNHRFLLKYEYEQEDDPVKLVDDLLKEVPQTREGVAKPDGKKEKKPWRFSLRRRGQR